VPWTITDPMSIRLEFVAGVLARRRSVAALRPCAPPASARRAGRARALAGAPGSTLIKSENSYLNNIVYVDVLGRDVGSYVSDARRLLDQELVLPPGYRLEWSGQVDAMDRARKRRRIVVPIPLGIIFGLLCFNFRNVSESAIVMLSLPFALVGGVWHMWILGDHRAWPWGWDSSRSPAWPPRPG
jgi:copper/silver efflux system protein